MLYSVLFFSALFCYATEDASQGMYSTLVNILSSGGALISTFAYSSVDTSVLQATGSPVNTSSKYIPARSSPWFRPGLQRAVESDMHRTEQNKKNELKRRQ